MHFLMLGCQIRLDNRATEGEAGSHSVDELRRQAKLGSLWHLQVLGALGAFETRAFLSYCAVDFKVEVDYDTVGTGQRKAGSARPGPQSR